MPKVCPWVATVTAADVQEVTQIMEVLADLDPVGGKPGPQPEKPLGLQGNLGYGSESVRQLLRWLGITPILAQRDSEPDSGLRVHR